MSALTLLQVTTAVTDSTATGMNALTKEVSVFDLIVGIDSTTGELSITNLVVMIALFTLSIFTVYTFVERYLSINKALKDERDFMSRGQRIFGRWKKLTRQKTCVVKPTTRLPEW